MIRFLRKKPRAGRPTTPTQHRFEGSDRNYPEGFPSGWYRILDSDELRPGDVRAVDQLGEHLVAYRTRDDREVVVLDAHCPHQGASLAAGGKVCGDQIECPFHAWRFGRDGALAAVPGLDRLPKAGVRRWPTVERYGMVWLYRDVSGRIVEPPYDAPRVPDLDDGSLAFRGAHDAGVVEMHVSEFVENSVDFQHFSVLHGQLTVPWTQMTIPGLGIQHVPGWEVDEHHRHIAYFSDQACITAFGTPYPQTGAKALITLFGPGATNWFRFSLPDLGDVVLFQTHSPLEPLRQHVRFRWWADRAIPRPLVWYVVGHWVSQWRADVEVWENKVFRPKPVLIPLDGPVHRMRRWYRQFYETATEP